MKHRLFLTIMLVAGVYGPWTIASAADRADLEGVTIRGDQESPGAPNSVPWITPRSPQVGAQLPPRLPSDALEPVDPESLRRALRYHEALTP